MEDTNQKQSSQAPQVQSYAEAKEQDPLLEGLTESDWMYLKPFPEDQKAAALIFKKLYDDKKFDGGIREKLKVRNSFIDGFNTCRSFLQDMVKEKV